MTEYLGALTAGHSMDFRYERNPRCPHCGSVAGIDDHELYSLYEEGEHEVECPACELEYMVSTHVEFTFSTDEQEGSE